LGRRPSPAGDARAPDVRAEALRIVLVEDSSADAELTQRELRRGGIAFEVSIVQTERDYRRALVQHRPQIILSDFALPDFDGARALAIAREAAPDTPFIFVSGTMGEENAVRALKEGATDYILKDNLLRLPAAVSRALEQARERAERRRAERALLDSETGLRRAQVMAGLAHVITGPDGSFESWSDNLSALVGCRDAELPRSVHGWLELVHPEDRDRFRTETIEAGRLGRRAEYEYRLRHRDGGWLHIRQVGDPIDAVPGTAGEPRWFATLQNVTAERQAAAALEASEARYRAAFEQAAVGVVHTELDGTIRMVNEAFCELSGYSRAEAIQLLIWEVSLVV
jgi:PAS domain S-box-containing protein